MVMLHEEFGRMDRTLVKFRHCGRDIYTFSDGDATLARFSEPDWDQEVLCPVCGGAPERGLLDAPVSVPCPWSSGHSAPRSFLIGTSLGPACLVEGHASELHVGLSNSTGLVYNYTLSGVQLDTQGWERCVCINLVHPWRENLMDSWDKELQLFSAHPAWTPERFQEEREFGSCCYGFALTFINHMRLLDCKDTLSKDEFTRSQVLPRMKRVSKYIKVYEEIQQRGFYVAGG